MRLSFTILLSVLSFNIVFPQVINKPKIFSISGFVHDIENNSYLAASTVSLQPIDRHVMANEDGFFKFQDVDAGNYILNVQFIGYDEMTIPITLTRDTLMHVHMYPAPLMLSEVKVNGINGKSGEQLSALHIEEISRGYLMQNNSTNFVQTLASVAGISSMDIGAGLSKPVIRGMGFNRVAVVDKGIVQQNQQWGADHGLEIDQYDVDRVRIYKGPMSLFYGSDAIGGVIEIMPPYVPKYDSFRGDVTLIGKSNNGLMGTSVTASSKKGNFYFKGRATVQNYADYRIPTDTIDYLTWRMPVYNRRMKNTAGREHSLSLSSNYTNEKFSSWLHISNFNTKNGFFPGAHGIPVLSRLEPDGLNRNIDLPHSTSNHLKLTSNSEWNLSDSDKINLDLGYQNNHREELSKFHTHYSNQVAPEVNPELELQFILNTYSAVLRYVRDENSKWSKVFGLSSEYQHNSVGGYSFLLPSFDRMSAGAFWINSFRLNEKLTIAGGIRYDLGKLSVEGSYDPILDEYLSMQGYEDQEIDSYAKRAIDIIRTYNNLSASFGIDYNFNTRHSLKLNVGNSFRYPGANELASNGVHHGAFRHELGNTKLDSEEGYQIDADYQYKGKKFSVTLNPFVNWFRNHIYLQPTGEWSILPHAGQIYKYNQSEALMTGGELIVNYDFDNRWSASSSLEHVFSISLEDNYPLPFSPPAVVTTDLSYSDLGRGVLTQYSFVIENRWVMDQNEVSRNEDMTPGANLWNLSAQVHWKINGSRVMTQLRADNIFNSFYLNHLSFYRKLNAPEPGRNIQLILKLLF